MQFETTRHLNRPSRKLVNLCAGLAIIGFYGATFYDGQSPRNELNCTGTQEIQIPPGENLDEIALHEVKLGENADYRLVKEIIIKMNVAGEFQKSDFAGDKVKVPVSC